MGSHQGVAGRSNRMAYENRLLLVVPISSNQSRNWPSWRSNRSSNPCLVVLVLMLFWAATGFHDQGLDQYGRLGLLTEDPPQNLIIDEHYLCTVAAGGHEKLSSPADGRATVIQIVVNRQLCIANAFEQVLEEKTLRFHRFLRRNYDRYGYPFAKHIKKK